MHRISRQAIVIMLAVLLLLMTVACTNTSYTSNGNIVEAAAVTGLVQQPNTVIIDARPQEEYAKNHLQGAVNLTPDLLSVNEPVPNLIAPAEQVASVLGSFGISNQSTVLVYDNNGGISAGRIWWVLKTYGHEQVKVINGGETAVLASGLPLTTDIPVVTPADYKPGTLNESLYASKEEVQAVIDGQSIARIIDVRSAAEYAEGAIPTATLYPHTKNLYKDGTFKSMRDIWLDYHDLKLNKDDAIILYCKTSFRAAQTMLVLTEAGFSNVSVYDGAWVEWTYVDAPAEKAEEPAATEATQPSEAAGQTAESEAAQPAQTEATNTPAETTAKPTEKPVEKPVVKPTEAATPTVQNAS